MKLHLLLCVFVLSVAVAGLAQASNVGQIEPMTSGTLVSLDSNPVVTAILSQPGLVNGKTYSGWSFLVQDNTGSLDIYATGTSLSGLGYTPTVGNIITGLSGTYSPYHQIPEIGTLTALTSDGPGTVPTPLLTTIPTINVTTEPFSTAGYLLELDNVTISGNLGNGTWGNGVSMVTGRANQSLTITDSLSNSMTLYYWPTSYSTDGAMYGQTIPTTPVNMLGFVSVVGSTPGTPEFTPISITPVPEPGTLFFLGAGFVAAAALYRRRKARK